MAAEGMMTKPTDPPADWKGANSRAARLKWKMAKGAVASAATVARQNEPVIYRFTRANIRQRSRSRGVACRYGLSRACHSASAISPMIARKRHLKAWLDHALGLTATMIERRQRHRAHGQRRPVGKHAQQHASPA